MHDIRRRTIHTIGDPMVRFREDPIRILRAIKFAARLDLGIAPDVYDAMVATREDLDQLLDFATRDWRSDWRGNLNEHSRDNSIDDSRGADFVSLYVYSHRVRGCDPGVYRWHRHRRSRYCAMWLSPSSSWWRSSM